MQYRERNPYRDNLGETVTGSVTDSFSEGE